MKNNLIPEEKYTAFDSEVTPHISSLKRYALEMTRDYDESEDLLQDTLLKAFRFFEKFDKGTNARAWLFKIMKNSFINSYREKIKQPLKIKYDDVQNFYDNIKSEEIQITHYQPDSFNNVMDDEIMNAFSILPDDFRTIVILSDIEGYTYKEISDFVDCPVGTVRSRLHRARKILYVLLYKYACKNSYVSSEKNRSIKSEIQECVNF